jgi:hypothetical protein
MFNLCLMFSGHIASQDYFKQSIELLENYGPAVAHLGAPIVVGKIALWNTKNVVTENAVRVCILITIFSF